MIHAWLGDRAIRCTATAVGAGLAVASLAASSAPAASTGSISGTVLNAATHAAVPNMDIDVYKASSGNLVTETFTDSTGKYTIGGLAPGSYKVGFSTKFHDGGNYVPQYYNGRPSLATAGPVTVTAGTTVGGISAAMRRGAQITGTITDAASHAAIFPATVTAYNASTGSVTGTATSTSSGSFAIQHLPSGSYKVGFSNYFYVPQYYHDKSSRAQANVLSLAAGATASGIGAAMVKAPVGQIRGTVTDLTTHAKLQGAFVAILLAAGGKYITSTSTTGGGGYSASVPAGSYKVSVSKFDYLEQYYNGQSSLASANPVSVTANHSTPGIDAALQLGGMLKGTVTDASSQAALGGAKVVIYQASTGKPFTEASTDTNGHWGIGGFPGGSYKACFTYLGSDYVQQCYNDEPYSLSAATPIPLQVGTTKSTIDAALRHGAKVSGTVTDSMTGQPLGGVAVTVYDASTGNAVGQASTGGAGTYTVMGGLNAVGLPTGSYKVGFALTGYASQYYNGKQALDTADTVMAAEGTTTTGISAALVPTG